MRRLLIAVASKAAVTDPSGAKIVGARIALRDRTGLKVYEARTDGEGKFSISNIAAGRYALTVEAEGFSQAKKIDLEVRDARGRDRNGRAFGRRDNRPRHSYRDED